MAWHQVRTLRRHPRLSTLVRRGLVHTLRRSLRRLVVTLPHQQSWELYHNNLSLCSKKTRVCLSELSIDYVSHHVDLIETGRYENVSREFLKVNPAGLVPVLVYQGHPVYESHEQIAFASARSDDPNLLVPVDPDRRGRRRTPQHTPQ